jgi:uncharacterized protein (DUF2336 family)
MEGIYDELKRIASERSSQKRLELLHKITDLFLEAGGTHTDAENYLFNEIMDKIVDQISQEAKVQVSANLATLPGFPLSVVRKLANDRDIEIARPVLRASPVLTDMDLVGIAMTGAQEHMHAIATRDKLSAAVTDVLIDRGNQRVVHSVSANHGAEVSNWGFEQLLEKARADVNLQELLVERPDLSQTTVEKLLPLISESVAIKLVERGFDVGETLTPDVLRLARDRFADALRDRRASIRGVAALVELVGAGELSLDQAVIELATEGRLLDVATLVSRSASLDLNDIFGIFTRGQLQMLMLLFRALDMQWPTLERVLILRAKKMGTPTPTLSDVARDYQALDMSLAKRAIRFLQVRYRLTGAPAEAGVPAMASA